MFVGAVGRSFGHLGGLYSLLNNVPVNTVAPAVTGTATVGQTLTTTNGTWLNSPTSYAYQWYQAITDGSGNPLTDGSGNYLGVAIGGATASTYTIVSGDVGQKLFCDVTATNAAGSAVKSSNVTAAVPAFWTPASLTNLVAWWGADSGVTTSGGNVTQVLDQSGHGYTLTPGANAVPFNAASAFNGKSGFEPTVANDAYLSTSLAGSPVVVLPNTANLSVFVVARMSSGIGGGARLVSIGTGTAPDGNSADNIVALCMTSGPDITTVSYPTGTINSAVVFDTNYRFGVIADGTNVTHYLNNVVKSSGVLPVSLASPQNIVIGNSWVGSSNLPPRSQPWQGTICEIVIASSVLSSTDRNNLDSYFTTKWGT